MLLVQHSWYGYGYDMDTGQVLDARCLTCAMTMTHHGVIGARSLHPTDTQRLDMQKLAHSTARLCSQMTSVGSSPCNLDMPIVLKRCDPVPHPMQSEQHRQHDPAARAVPLACLVGLETLVHQVPEAGRLCECVSFCHRRPSANYASLRCLLCH